MKKTYVTIALLPGLPIGSEFKSIKNDLAYSFTDPEGRYFEFPARTVEESTGFFREDNGVKVIEWPEAKESEGVTTIAIKYTGKPAEVKGSWKTLFEKLLNGQMVEKSDETKVSDLVRELVMFTELDGVVRNGYRTKEIMLQLFDLTHYGPLTPPGTRYEMGKIDTGKLYRVDGDMEDRMSIIYEEIILSSSDVESLLMENFSQPKATAARMILRWYNHPNQIAERERRTKDALAKQFVLSSAGGAKGEFKWEEPNWLGKNKRERIMSHIQEIAGCRSEIYGDISAMPALIPSVRQKINGCINRMDNALTFLAKEVKG